MSGKPIIAITLDWQESGSFSSRPHYALREHYVNVIEKAGGIPVLLPYLENMIDEYLDLAGGLLIPGGFFASPPSWYIGNDGKSPYEESPRLNFDLELIEKALKRDMPILGICAGMQLMAGLYGCKMTPDIHKHISTKIDHLNGEPAESKAHKIILENGSGLIDICGSKEFDINSAHREAIISVTGDVLISGKAEDGTIEAVEIKGKKFAYGVQWHPEFFDSESDPSFKLFKALVRAAND